MDRYGRLCMVLGLIAVLVRGTAASEAERLFADLDRDGNGQLTGQEVGKSHKTLFSRLIRTGDGDENSRLSLAEFCAALEPVRAEKPPVEKQGSSLPGSEALVILLAKMDANADQQLDRDEIPQRFVSAYDRMVESADADKNGRLDAREISQQAPRLTLVAAMAARQMGLDVSAELAQIPPSRRQSLEQMDAYEPQMLMADAASATAVFDQIDDDGDGRLSKSEAPERMLRRFEQLLSRYDADGDGQFSRDEFARISRALSQFQSAGSDRASVDRMVGQLLSRFDRDESGSLDRREVPPRMLRNFEQLDQNADRVLDAGELKRAAAALDRLSGASFQRRDGEAGRAEIAGERAAQVAPSGRRTVDSLPRKNAASR